MRAFRVDFLGRGWVCRCEKTRRLPPIPASVSLGSSEAEPWLNIEPELGLANTYDRSGVLTSGPNTIPST